MQTRRLIDHPDLIKTAVEEFLRSKARTSSAIA